MHLKEETLYASSDLIILDADCKKDDVIVLLKGKGENTVRLNGKTILIGPVGNSKIRFTKEHFCLLNDSTLSFYTVTGELVSRCDVGTDVFELFPYKQGVLCLYGDEGVFGTRIGKNRVNYAAPSQGLESCYDMAISNDLLYEALFARHKPYACLSWERNKLLLLNEQLEREKAFEVPFDAGNTIAFALTHECGLFIEENKLRFWAFGTTGQVSEYPGEFSYNTRAIFSRHEFSFVTVSDSDVRAFKPIVDDW